MKLKEKKKSWIMDDYLPPKLLINNADNDDRNNFRNTIF